MNRCIILSSPIRTLAVLVLLLCGSACSSTRQTVEGGATERRYVFLCNEVGWHAHKNTNGYQAVVDEGERLRQELIDAGLWIKLEGSVAAIGEERLEALYAAMRAELGGFTADLNMKVTGDEFWAFVPQRLKPVVAE